MRKLQKAGIQNTGFFNFPRMFLHLQRKMPTESHYERFHGSQGDNVIQKGTTNLDNFTPVRKNKTIWGKSGVNYYTRPSYVKKAGRHPASVRMTGI